MSTVVSLDEHRPNPNLRCTCGGEWWQSVPELAADDEQSTLAVVFDTVERRITGWAPGVVACVSCGALEVIR